MAALGDQHRIFLQAFMWRKICKAKEVLELYRYCLNKCNNEIENVSSNRVSNMSLEIKKFEKKSVPVSDTINPNELSQFVNKINSFIRPIHMEIRKGIEEDTGINCYALVNTTNSSVSVLSSDYTVVELEYFKKIVDKIVMSEDGVASSVALLNLTDELDRNRRLSKHDAENLIKRFVENKFLCENNGVISLSVRSMIELDPYMRQIYNEVIVMCPMCNQIVLKGQNCDKCDSKLHLHCAARYFRGKHELRCPRCNAIWPHTISKQGNQSSPGASTSRRS